MSAGSSLSVYPLRGSQRTLDPSIEHLEAVL